MRSDAQSERQAARAKSGKYARMNTCEMCGKHLGAKHYSAPDCNETGIGVMLCRRCATDPTTGKE